MSQGTSVSGSKAYSEQQQQQHIPAKQNQSHKCHADVGGVETTEPVFFFLVPRATRRWRFGLLSPPESSVEKELRIAPSLQFSVKSDFAPGQGEEGVQGWGGA